LGFDVAIIVEKGRQRNLRIFGEFPNFYVVVGVAGNKSGL